jgi:xylose dehydrogenase (NAD/NADP)
MAGLRWGILGPGRISTRIVRAVRAADRAELVAVGSRDADRAAAYAARFGIGQAFGSYDALLASPDVDVVYIALPNHLHAEWTIRALEAGKHVLCEKPLALRVADVEAIEAASREAGRIAVEAFMYLHHPQIVRVLELVEGGQLGQLELVRGSFSFLLSAPDDPRVDPDMGGGSLWDVGCYPVSFARRVTGQEPDRLAASARFDERGVDRTFVGQLHFPSGVLAQFDSGFVAADREELEIVGREARIVVSSPFLPEPDGPPPRVTLWRGLEPERIDVGSLDQYHAEVDNLTSAILDGTAPRVSLEFSRGNIAALAELDRVARSA